MKKLISKYDCFGNEYGIFYRDGVCYLYDCFDFVHDGAPLASGDYGKMCKMLAALLTAAEESRF